jgi:tRNA threonylcarbamoyladenosine biosynthesis protein TsaB
VPTIDALAEGIGPLAGSRLRLAAIDARRGEVFAALYDAAGNRLWGPEVGTAEELGDRLGEHDGPPLGAGSGAVRFRQELSSRGVEIPDDADPVHHVAARHICRLAAAPERGSDVGPVAPIYLRPPDAKRWRERDTFQESE